MNIETIISFLGLLGVGGVIGSYLQHLWNQKRETELKIQNINENKYRSILMFMRCVLEPENVDQFSFNNPNIQKQKNPQQVKKYVIRNLTELYYNSFLYASDEVIILFSRQEYYTVSV